MSSFYRKHYLRQCKTDLQQCLKYLEMSEKKLARAGTDFIHNKIQQDIDRLRQKKQSLQMEVNGFFNEDKFQTFVQKNQHITEMQHSKATLRKNSDASKTRKIRIQKENALANVGTKYDRSYKNVSEREMDRSLQYMEKMTASMPDYMKKNLTRLPNNKGYIWRGIHFYGHKPAESRTTILFEKNLIHTWAPDGYTVTKKAN
jgi:paraquat-inducible protein B